MKELSFNEIRDFRHSLSRKRDRIVKIALLREERDSLSRKRRSILGNNIPYENVRYVGQKGDNLDEFFEKTINQTLTKK